MSKPLHIIALILSAGLAILLLCAALPLYIPYDTIQDGSRSMSFGDLSGLVLGAAASALFALFARRWLV